MTISEQKQKTIDENDQLYNNIKILGWTLITKGYTIYLYNDKHKYKATLTRNIVGYINYTTQKATHE